jgi:predicted aldo/keto reductase-like oxidoreductase
MLARKNIEKIESTGVKRVVTSCAGCGKCFEFCPVRLDIPKTHCEDERWGK